MHFIHSSSKVFSSKVFLGQLCRNFAKGGGKTTSKAPPPPTPAISQIEPAVPKKKRPLEATEEAHVQPYNLDRWTDWKMKKDYLRRQMVIRLGRERMLINSIHMNTILPLEIREEAVKEVEEDLPRDSNYTRLTNRCAITSRPRACVLPWRVSRHMFRHFADYNKLSGVQRGIW